MQGTHPPTRLRRIFHLALSLAIILHASIGLAGHSMIVQNDIKLGYLVFELDNTPMEIEALKDGSESDKALHLFLKNAEEGKYEECHQQTHYDECITITEPEWVYREYGKMFRENKEVIQGKIELETAIIYLFANQDKQYQFSLVVHNIEGRHLINPMSQSDIINTLPDALKSPYEQGSEPPHCKGAVRIEDPNYPGIYLLLPKQLAPPNFDQIFSKMSDEELAKQYEIDPKETRALEYYRSTRKSPHSAHSITEEGGLVIYRQDPTCRSFKSDGAVFDFWKITDGQFTIDPLSGFFRQSIEEHGGALLED